MQFLMDVMLCVGFRIKTLKESTESQINEVQLGYESTNPIDNVLLIMCLLLNVLFKNVLTNNVWLSATSSSQFETFHYASEPHSFTSCCN